jgi:hypothetical protein
MEECAPVPVKGRHGLMTTNLRRANSFAISKPDEKGHAMRGIAGWVSYDSDLRTQRDVIATMTKTMALSAVRMRAASGSIGMSVWDIAASPSSTLQHARS